mgnify:FL=1
MAMVFGMALGKLAPIGFPEVLIVWVLANSIYYAVRRQSQLASGH